MQVVIALAAALLAASSSESPPRTAVVSGVVLDEGGRPVADAGISFQRSNEGTFEVFADPLPEGPVRTDASGRFSMRTAPGLVAVAAARRVTGAIMIRLVPVRVGAQDARVMIRFDGSAAIRGRAIDEAGRPLAGVRITAIPEPTGASAKSGNATIVRTWSAADGTFLLAGLGSGDHRLVARGAGHNCVEACEFGLGMRVRTGGSAVDVPMDAMGSVSGRVVRRDVGGRVVPVTAFTVKSAAFQAVHLESADGGFDIDVPRLWEKAPLFVEAAGLAPFATRFDLTEPVNVDLGQIVLGRGRRVRGTVRDASGQAVEGARVQVGFASKKLAEPVAVTDAGGVFELAGIDEGDAALAVSHPRFRPGEVVARPGTPAVAVTLSRGIDLRVRVEDVDGAPLAGAYVWNVIALTACRTGADGICTLNGLEKTEQVLEVSMPGTARPKLRQLRVPITREDPPLVNVRLPRTPTLLRVTVVEPSGTFANADVWLVLGEVTPERALASTGNVELPYHASGIDLVKSYENVAPGRYTILVQDAVVSTRRTARTIDLGDGAQESVVVTLPPGGAGRP